MIQKITELAEQDGWSVTTTTDAENSTTTFEFSKYTPAGQDFSFSIEMRKGKISSLISNINDYYQSFDPDYETYLWIGTDGHGKNGAPYHIKDIVKDMEAAEDMIWELHNLLFNELL